MFISAPVQDILAKEITLKSGPRAGKTSQVFTAVVDGKKIDLGFKCLHRKGDLFEADITDVPDKWGMFKLTGQGTRLDTKTTGTTPGVQVEAPKTWDKGFPIARTNHATSICRQNALTNAINYYNMSLSKSEGATVEQVLNVANQFAKWTTGQTEMEEAERILSASTHVINA